MENITKGWVVINIGHPSTGTKYMVSSTFATTRAASIKLFISGYGESWKYWKAKYNFRVVRSTQCITTDYLF